MANDDLTKKQTDGLDQQLRDLNEELLISSVHQHELTEKAEHAEQLLRISEEQFRMAILEAPIPVIMHAEDGEVLNVSRSWTELTGYTKEDTSVIQTWLTKAYGYGGEQVRDMMRQAFLPPIKGEKALHETTFDITTRGGETRTWWFHASAPGLLADGRRFAVGMAADITDRNRTEEALRVSEEKYRTLFQSIDEGFCLIEIQFDESGEAYDYVFLEANAAFERQSGLVDAVGRSIRELVPGLEAQWINMYARVATTGEPIRFEADVASMARVFDIYAFTGGENKVAVVFNDITERKRHEANLSFLAEVSRELVALTNTGDTMNALGAKIGAYFGATRVGFFEFNEAMDRAVCQYDWHAKADEVGFVGNYRTADFYTDADEFVSTLRSGEAFVLEDGTADGRVLPDNLAALDIRSFIVVPANRDARLPLSVLALNDNKARDWRDDEIELLRELTTRIWTRLERARAEDRLAEHTRLFEALTESVLDGILVVSPDGQMLHHNQQFLNIWNFPAEIIESKSDEAALAWASEQTTDAAAFLARVTDIYSDPTSQFREEMTMKDGRVYERFGAPVQYGETRLGWIWTFRDITERKRSEEMVTASELRMRLALTAANMYSWEIDVETRTTTITEDSAEVLGFRRSDGRAAITDQVATVIHPDDRAPVSEALERSYETGELRQEMRFITPGTGEIVWAETRGTVRHDADGKAVKLYGVTQNINERKRAEAALARYSEELEATVKVRTRELRETNKGLKAENKERRRLEAERLSLLAAITTVQEDERRRMALDLHDHFGQQLTALRFRIEILGTSGYADEQFQQIVADAKTLVRQIDEDVDALSFDLRPPSLDDIGLTASLEDYVGEWSRRFQIPVHFQARRFGSKRLPPDSETHIYRITQEILTNIQKHANANVVDIALEKRRGVAILSVMDDGIGFHLNAGKSKRVGSGGLGLVGMRERAAIIGGTLDIVSVPDVGTTVTLRVPTPRARIREKDGQ